MPPEPSSGSERAQPRDPLLRGRVCPEQAQERLATPREGIDDGELGRSRIHGHRYLPGVPLDALEKLTSTPTYASFASQSFAPPALVDGPDAEYRAEVEEVLLASLEMAH